MQQSLPPVSPGEVYELLPVGSEAVEIEVLSLPAEVIVGMFVPLQDGTEGPTSLHGRLELTQRVVWQQRHRYVIEQPLTERLEGAKEAKVRKM